MGAALLGTLLGLTPTSAAFAGEQVEQLTIAPPPSSPDNIIYVVGFDFIHGLMSPTVAVIDGRAERMRALTHFTTGVTPQAVLSPDGSELFASATYMTRLVRGTRDDVVETYDLKALAFKGEVAVPTKRSSSMVISGMMAVSKDGRYLFVQNATPASSVTVIDRSAGKTIGELGTAGCWTVHPSSTDAMAFDTVCGDGTFVTITFSADGTLKSTKRSARIFDPAEDPLIPNGAKWGSKEVFVTYGGVVHVVSLGGDSATADAPWALARGDDARQEWRPGGWQLLAVDERTNRLFVTMHRQGRNGTHHQPADEIWAVDLNTHAVLERIKGDRAVSLAFSTGSSPALFAIAEDGQAVNRYTQTAEGMRLTGSLPLVNTGMQILVK